MKKDTQTKRPSNPFDSAAVRVLEDGRVEAVVSDDGGDEVIYRTSQAKAAAWIANDVGRRIQTMAAKIRPFEGE
jgi:hypothetical protein